MKKLILLAIAFGFSISANAEIYKGDDIPPNEAVLKAISKHVKGNTKHTQEILGFYKNSDSSYDVFFVTRNVHAPKIKGKVNGDVHSGSLIRLDTGIWVLGGKRVIEL